MALINVQVGKTFSLNLLVQDELGKCLVVKNQVDLVEMEEVLQGAMS